MTAEKKLKKIEISYFTLTCYISNFQWFMYPYISSIFNIWKIGKESLNFSKIWNSSRYKLCVIYKHLHMLKNMYRDFHYQTQLFLAFETLRERSLFPCKVKVIEDYKIKTHLIKLWNKTMNNSSFIVDAMHNSDGDNPTLIFYIKNYFCSISVSITFVKIWILLALVESSSFFSELVWKWNFGLIWFDWYDWLYLKDIKRWA